MLHQEKFKNITKEFERLLSIMETLLGPNGCPWDREQTIQSLRYSVLEETCEVIEAIDLDQNGHICEELGDLFFNAAFLCQLAQKEERFLFQKVLFDLNEKIIRRHPHVFGESFAASEEELAVQWENIKKQEKAAQAADSVLDSLPRGLPSLSRAFKSLKRMEKAQFDQLPANENYSFTTEEELGELLLKIANSARKKKIDPEHALRKQLALLESKFRLYEEKLDAVQ